MNDKEILIKTEIEKILLDYIDYKTISKNTEFNYKDVPVLSNEIIELIKGELK